MNILINIDVPDLNAAEKFYVEAFGLTAGRRFGGEVLELLGLPVPIYLLEKKPGTHPVSGSSLKRDYTRHWCPVHPDFVVEDIDMAVNRARTAGAQIESGIKTHAWGKIVVCADPYGNGFCLIQFLGRGYDEITQRS